MSRNAPLTHLAPRLLVAALLLAAAALTGCTAAPSSTAPSFFNAAHVSPEPISTLGENYVLPPDPRHHYRLHELPSSENINTTHRSL